MTTIDEATHKTLESVTHRAIEEKATFERPGGTLLRRYEGDLIPIEEDSSPLRNSEGEILGFVTTFRDVSKIRSLTSELSHLASHDPLTGLPNRTLLYDRLTRHLTHADRHTEMVAVLYLDLDLFKRVNDAHGHSIGDELLQQVAGRLLKCVRKTDTVSRLGGDEFAILLADFNQTAFPGEIGSKIIRKLRSSFILNHDTVNISASIGISLFPEDSHDAATLIKYADTAMYQAKESGRGHVQFFAQEMNERAVERRKLEKDLRTALEQNQLSLHFQPQIDLKTGGLVGVEALLRWQHPQRGFIPPDRFISVAEDNGDLMVLIGHWVLKHACAQVRLWLDAGHRPLRMSINVSIAQLRNEDFLPFLEGVLQNYRIPPDLLQVELTESIIMSDVMGAIDRIRGLKALGVHLAIDDFGTGYSSLSYLKMLPVNELKIDQSFVRKNLETGTDNATIIQAVIQMSQSLGLRVVAEGVETEEAVDFLIENKCDVAQGYYYSKALPAPIFERQFLCIRRS
jgi:diguanylate cyclase (GGDEF)-like protein